jgi:hypothetical protein
VSLLPLPCPLKQYQTSINIQTNKRTQAEVVELSTVREATEGDEDLTEGWRKLPNWELHNFHFSPNIRVMKSRRVRLAKHTIYVKKCRKEKSWRTQPQIG